MKISPLKAGLIVLPLVGIAVFLYVVFSAMNNPSNSAYASYATGEMRQLVFLDDAPPRPTIPFTDGDGNTVRLADFEGRVVLLNLWATWCGPCIVEMPMLDELQGEFGGDDFQVVTVSLDRTIEEPREFYAENGIEHLPLFHDSTFALPSQTHEANQPAGLPMTILYDRRGIEIARMPRDADWSSDEARALIRAAIAQG